MRTLEEAVKFYETLFAAPMETRESGGRLVHTIEDPSGNRVVLWQA